jgi:hypothetical protein
MNRSKQLLLVFAELRSALGDTMTAREVLETAERLVDLANYREIINRCGTADYDTPGCVPLDRAFDDGGWALLHQGYASGMLGDDDPADYHSRSGRPVASLMEHWA